MIPKETVQRVLQAALQEGADFAELYYENTQRNSLQYRDGKVETVLSGLDAGAGIRVFPARTAHTHIPAIFPLER